MNTARFIHQQVFQLKWHVLACLGLIMGVPLEEAVVNLHAGEGFHSSSLTVVTLFLGPLLAALIACANVQADLDEKRDAFWRSKPVSVWQFITGKFFIGLILTSVIVACPILFMWITTSLTGGLESLVVVKYLLFVIPLISVLTYSVCFFCNVLVRKTARAWLIGMAIACFTLLIPFILPLNIKDVATDLVMVKWFLGSILVATLGLAVLSFMGAIVAVQRNWQIHTQLRGLLWGGAGLIFAVILLFSRQIANIKILDEKHFPEDAQPRFVKIDEKTSLRYYSGVQKYCEINTLNHKIELVEHTEMPQQPLLETVLKELDKAKSLAPKFDYHPDMKRDPMKQVLYLESGSLRYRFVLSTYYRIEPFIKENGAGGEEHVYEKAYLRSYRMMEGGSVPVESLDLSDYLKPDVRPRMVMRSVEDKAVALLSETCLVIDISDPQAMAVVESQPTGGAYYGPGERIALIPAESIGIKDRIRLSMELCQDLRYRRTQIFPTNNDTSDYVTVSKEGIALYRIEKWDEKQIYAKLLDKRPYTFWERMYWHDQLFIRHGKLYCRLNNRLMVFDVSGTRIRKLGHYERLSQKYRVATIEVDTDGNILMLTQHEERQGKEYKRTAILQLLKNPE